MIFWAGLIDLGDELIGLSDPTWSASKGRPPLKVSGTTPIAELEGYFDPVDDDNDLSSSHCGEIELTVRRTAFRDAEKKPIMPRPVIVGPYRRKAFRVTRTSHSQRDATSILRDLGLPVSTTHVLSSGIAGTMLANGSGMQWSTLRNIALAWVLTLPMAMILSGVLYAVFRNVF